MEPGKPIAEEAGTRASDRRGVHRLVGGGQVKRCILLPMTVGNFLWINAIVLNEASMVTHDILVVVYPFTGPCRHVRIVGRHKAYRLRDEMVATGAVTHVHIKGSGSRTLFLIPIDVKTMHAMATEEQLLDRRRIAMKVDNYRTIRCKQGIEQLVIQAMRVLRFLLQHH